MSLAARSTLGPVGFVRPNPTAVPFAWANIDGQNDTPLLRDSENVSSLTDNGTADYTIVFALPATDVSYATIGGASRTPATNDGVLTVSDAGGQTAASVRVITCNTDAIATEVAFVHVVCIGVA